MSLIRQKRCIAAIPAAAMLSAALFAGSGAFAQATDGTFGQENAASARDEATLTLDLVDAPFTTAVNLIRQKTGIQIALLPSERPYEKVTVSLRGKPVSEALRLVSQAAGADIWQSNGVYMIGPHGSAPKPEPPEALLPNLVAEQPPVDWKLEKIHLQYQTPATILRLLGMNRTEEPDLLESLRLSGLRQLANLDGGDGGPKPFSSPPQFLNPDGSKTSPNAPGAPTSNSIYTTPLQLGTSTGTGPRRMTVTPTTGGSADQNSHRAEGADDEFGRGQGFPGGFGGGQGGFGGGQGGFGGGQGGFGGGQGGFGGQGGQGGQNQPGVANASPLLPPGLDPTDIIALDADGSLLLRYATAQQLKQFRQLIQLLDVKPRQILIRAQFVTVTQNDVTSFGINWNFTKVNLQAGANVGYSSANTAFIQYAIGNLQTQLDFILTTGRGKLITAPTATTLNGIAARFNNIQQIPVITQNQTIGFNGTTVLQANITIVQVLVTLVVTPYINGDDTLTLLGNVVSQDVIGSVTNPAGGTIPIIAGQQAIITRIVRNGDTMVISGLTRKRDTVNTNKVPLLGDLPLIGTLFRSRNVSTDDSELLVFITPEIIVDRPTNTGNAGGNGALGGAPAGGGSGGPGILP